MKIFAQILLYFLLSQNYSIYGQFIQVYKPESGGSIREFHKIKAAGEGNFVVLGYNEENQNGDISLTKLNLSGDLVWQKVIAGTGIDYANGFIQTADGGFIVVGYTDGATGIDIDFLVIKVDSGGELVWSKQFGGANDEEAFGACQLSDGDIVVCGSAWFGSTERRGYAVRLTNAGTEIWSKTFKQGNFNAFREIVAFENNESVLCGYSWLTSSNTNFDPYFVRINGDGEAIWSKRLRQSGPQILYSARADVDGGVVFGGVSSPPGNPNKGLIGKISGAGAVQWVKEFGGNTPCRVWDLAVLPSGGYISTGFSDKNNVAGARRNGFISRLSSTGQPEETAIFGSADTNTTTFTGIDAYNGLFYSTGFTYQYGNTNGAGILAMSPVGSLESNCSNSTEFTSSNLASSDSNGVSSEIWGIGGMISFSNETNDLDRQIICLIESVNGLYSNSELNLVPNPSESGFSIQHSAGNQLIEQVQIFNSTGDLVQEIMKPEVEKSLDISHFAAGIYQVRALVGTRFYSGKLVKK